MNDQDIPSQSREESEVKRHSGLSFIISVGVFRTSSWKKISISKRQIYSEEVQSYPDTEAWIKAAGGE